MTTNTAPQEAQQEQVQPCPFCGGEAEVTIESSYYQVMCKDEEGCTALGLFGHVDRATAIREWNRRAREDELRARVAELEGQLAEARKPMRVIRQPDSVIYLGDDE